MYNILYVFDVFMVMTNSNKIIEGIPNSLILNNRLHHNYSQYINLKFIAVKYPRQILSSLADFKNIFSIVF